MDPDDFDNLYDDYEDDEPCDHEECEVDIMTGRASCWRCGETWWLSSDELKEELRLAAELAASFDEHVSKP